MFNWKKNAAGFRSSALVLIFLSGCNSPDSGSTAGTPLPQTVPSASPLAAQKPRITSFTPVSGIGGTSVTLNGSFGGVISAVKFGSLPATSFTLAADGQSIVAVAPAKVDTDKISVENSLGTDTSTSSFESYCSPILSVANSVVITDLSVVGDAKRTVYNKDKPSQGVWTLSYLMGQMKPPSMSTSDFILSWLNQWKSVTSVNGFPVPTRSTIDQVISNWPKLGDGTLDLERAPFRLLAITNRIDLRSTKNAGEGRFVFGLVDVLGVSQKFTVIFEYQQLFANGETLNSWALQWHDLSLETLPSTKFNSKLADLTAKFSNRNFTDVAGTVNGNAIGQIRTNEIFLLSPWELREFHLDAASGQLVQSVTAQTPDITLRATSTLDDWMTANATAILSGTSSVPSGFLGGAAPALNLGFKWKNASNSGVSESVRHAFSLNTCSGCHAGETSTAFMHLNPREITGVSVLSQFLQDDSKNRLNGLKNLVIQNNCQ